MASLVSPAGDGALSLCPSLRSSITAWLANVLLGSAQTEAMLADAVPLSRYSAFATWEQQLHAAGAADDPARRIGLIKGRCCAAEPLRMITRNRETGPIPLAAAHTAERLQALPGVIAASVTAIADGDVSTVTAQAPKLWEARQALQTAIVNNACCWACSALSACNWRRMAARLSTAISS